MRSAALEWERLGARRWRRWRGVGQRPQHAEQLGAAGGAAPVAPGGTRERASAGLERFAAGAERAHGHEQAVLECDVPSNGTRRRNCGGKLLRKMRERDGRIEDAAQVFDEMSMHAVLKNARVLLLGEASRVQDAIGRMLRRCAEQRCAGAARQGRGERGSSR
jgi:hypothetical protein